VEGLSGAAAIATTTLQACALKADGTVQCWVLESRLVPREGEPMPSLGPSPVDALAGAIAIALGGEVHTCALLADGTITCLDLVRARYEHGDDNPNPETVPRITDATAISVGPWHKCAVRKNGGVTCWGGNGSGQLGDGTRNFRSDPVTVHNLSGVKAVVAGNDHTCALLRGGGVKCWGRNVVGQLGQGTTQTYIPSPVAVAGISNAIAISESGDCTCVLLRDGGVKCWGGSYGLRPEEVPVA
jgi:hypothetical protein